MTYAKNEGPRLRQPSRAAIFVDYENVYRVLDEMPSSRGQTVEAISQMIGALRQMLQVERETSTAIALAYADFTSMDGIGDGVQHGLYLQGVEPRFVPRALHANTVEIQLCVDAMDLMHHRMDIDTFVLLTGRRTYLPLVQQVRRYGRHVLVTAFEGPPANVQHLEGDWFLDARELLGTSVRRESAKPKTRTVAGNGSGPSRKAAGFKPIGDAMLLRTLEIIDDYFGQYEEVYLTPLLRKMSEVIEDRDCDPKSLISDLEDHLAVRLEKRQGFPHDYTVLILEETHPDVERVRAEADNRVDVYDAGEYAEDGYAEDEYAEDGYGEYDEEYDEDGQAEYEFDDTDEGYDPDSDLDVSEDDGERAGRL